MSPVLQGERQTPVLENPPLNLLFKGLGLVGYITPEIIIIHIQQILMKNITQPKSGNSIQRIENKGDLCR